MRRLCIAALAVLSALSPAAWAQGDPGLQIGSSAKDVLLLVANASTPLPPSLVRLIGSSLGHPNDGTPVAIAGTQPMQCAASKSVTMHPNGRFIYLTADTGTAGSVCGYEFDPQSLTLTPVQGSPFRAGRGTRSIVMDPAGRFVYAANFDDGSISGYSVNAETGALNTLSGSAFVAADDSTGFAAIDPLGRFVYATNSAANGTVSGFTIDRDNGALTPVPKSPLATPPFPGALAVDPRGKYLYVAANPNQVYSINQTTGQLTPTGVTFGPFAQGMAFDPTGRYLYTSSGSGADSRINAYRVDAAGTPTAIDNGVPTGSNPLGVAVSRTGRHVYTANLLDGNISGFRINDATGALMPIDGSPFPAGENAYNVATFGALAIDAMWQTGEPLARPIVAFGGRLPYTWAITPGTLPLGLSFLADLGVVAGTPTATGAYAFTARVTDAFGGVVTKNFTFTIKSDVAPPGSATVIEYYNVALDHYFITWIADEIAKLDDGTVIKGWTRTGQSFNTYIAAQAGSSPICRYYIPPALGNSHFFGRGTVECDATGTKNPSFVLEDPSFMFMILPAAGVCPASTTPVYRVFSNRADANHRYLTDRALRDAMATKGWVAEGDGPDLVVMCAP
jgi:6-phosphogluconolactonase (cycloisomerase 2 family)